MKRINDFIIEKLRISKNNINNDITFEDFCKVFEMWGARNRYPDASIELDKILGSYPKVLDYNGDFTHENIVGKEIVFIGYHHSDFSNKDMIYMDFDFNENGIEVYNIDDLYDIFGDEVLNKIYEYLSK